MKDGCALIAEERQRQVEGEGWTPEHDDEHDDGELALAAVAYAMPADGRHFTDRGVRVSARAIRDVVWPWVQSPKPGDRIRELVKAGALIAAEIDRLQRGGTSVSADA